MHKNLVHAQDSCACERILCMHKILVKPRATHICSHSKTNIIFRQNNVRIASELHTNLSLSRFVVTHPPTKTGKANVSFPFVMADPPPPGKVLPAFSKAFPDPPTHTRKKSFQNPKKLDLPRHGRRVFKSGRRRRRNSFPRASKSHPPRTQGQHIP